jgi:hypothetical protein
MPISSEYGLERYTNPVFDHNYMMTVLNETREYTNAAPPTSPSSIYRILESIMAAMGLQPPALLFLRACMVL